MHKEQLKQVLETTAGVASLWVLWQVIRGAFTPEQRFWFHERDEHQCQFPVDYSDKSYVPCGSSKNIQIHHLKPQRWSKYHGKTEDEIDCPENGISLCEAHHQGVIHNDMLAAKLAYGKNKDSYKKAFAKRNELVEQELPYWNTAYDEVMERIINARNRMFEKPFPEKRRGKASVR